ncbi:uncharacterized protein [Macrobrachium rosenbergii]|uniref:uncharacterized protein n=1 Tax=Macrobrachium rosenbergii TaxID=79674 RepID=UPI0034D5C76E
MAESCIKSLVDWVSRHGVSQIITSDRGANFTSTLWNNLANSLETKITHTTACNPKDNGIIERMHQSLKTLVTARCQGESWRKELSWVLLGLRTTTHMAFNTSPAEVLYNQVLTLPEDVFQERTNPTSPSDTQKVIEKIIPAKTTYQADREVFVPEDLQNVKYFIPVGARKPHLFPAYSGPHRILQGRQNAYQMTVDGRTTWV